VKFVDQGIYEEIRGETTSFTLSRKSNKGIHAEGRKRCSPSFDGSFHTYLPLPIVVTITTRWVIGLVGSSPLIYYWVATGSNEYVSFVSGRSRECSGASGFASDILTLVCIELK
jgi:hypothetical protein